MCLYLHPFLSFPPLLPCVSVVSVCFRYIITVHAYVFYNFHFVTHFRFILLSIKRHFAWFHIKPWSMLYPRDCSMCTGKTCILLLLALCTVCVACGVLRFLSICLVIHVFQCRVLKPATGWTIMYFSLPSCVYLLHIILGAQVLSVL